jgi:glycosyltransferase involved in cell wall biosynthesis
LKRKEVYVQSHRHPLAVVIPTYNRADTLMQCLFHLENQSWKDFEVVVVDDGSTDSTPEQMRSYASKGHLPMRYVRQDNGGPARARNHAISLVEAPLCLMIGDDIFASPKLLAEHMRLHLRHPEPAVAGLGLTRWSESGQTVTPFMKWLDGGGMQFHYGPLLRGEKPDWRHFYTSNLSLKTEVLKQFPFDESFPYAAMEDMELACRIEEKHGLELVFLPDALAHHLHPTTFIQACRRMVQVGEATAHFEQIWPGKRPHSGNAVRRAMQNFLLAKLWVVPTSVKLANWSLKFACPNYLMRYVLRCHFALGYGRYLQGRL